MLFKEMFKSGETINNNIKIIELIDYGGQGEVYKVEYYNNIYALKWYYPQNVSKELKDSLFNLIIKGPPTNDFLWPISLIEFNNQFGYLMELRPPNFRSLNDWVNLDFDISLTNLTKACYKLTNAFHKLHASGFSYKDISLNNIFIEPNNGGILICDNDNITPNGQKVNGLLGTPKFMAPEIVMGSSVPNTESDQFSLAILLFYILVISHPFEGKLEMNIKCFDNEAAKKLYGIDAVYIYDKNNDINRPVWGIHNNAIKLWDLYPNYIKKLFHQTFTVGIKNPAQRTRESEWRSAFLKMYNSLLKCPHCGTENLYDINVLRKKGKLNPCLYCNKEYKIPPRIRINKNIIVLDDGKEIFGCHIKEEEPFNTDVIGKVKYENSIYYLANLSDFIWNNNNLSILPKQVIALKNVDFINFGNVIGEIRS